MLHVLARWNRWGGAELPSGQRRQVTNEIVEAIDGKQVLTLIGPRRAGKTTVMFQLIDELERRGRPTEAVLHINFEEPAFARGLDNELLEQLYRAYREQVFPEGRAYLFLDEVQHVAAWERWVRARNESEDIKIVVTGSSAELMSRELASRLTGRHLEFRVFPLCFREMLDFRSIPVPSSFQSDPPKVIQALGEYLHWGGFPEVVLAKDERRKQALLRQYFDDLLFKDVAIRHNVRDIATLRALAVHLLTNTSGLVSYQRLAKLFGVSLDLVRSYCSYLEEAFLIRLLPHYSLKVAKRRRRPQKVHAYDLGLRAIASLSESPDWGHLAETAVFQHLARHHHENIYYWSGTREVDLVLRDGNRVSQLLQVVYEGMDVENVSQRELGGLTEAAKRFRYARQTLIVGRARQTAFVESRPSLDIVPIWRFLLDGV